MYFQKSESLSVGIYLFSVSEIMLLMSSILHNRSNNNYFIIYCHKMEWLSNPRRYNQLCYFLIIYRYTVHIVQFFLLYIGMKEKKDVRI